MKKRNRILSGFSWIALSLILGATIASYANIKDLKLLDFEFVATTIGVLLGFGLTIYTFILQLIPPITESIKKSSFAEPIKQKTVDLLMSSERELREDLLLMFVCLIIVLIVGIIANTFPLTDNIQQHVISRIPETVYMSVYLLAFLALRDLMLSLFGIGRITISLLNASPPSPSGPNP